MSDDAVRVDSEGAVLRLHLDRPDKLNALTGAMYATLAAALRAADSDPAVGAVLLSGEGRAFCAGNDLGDFLGDPPTGPDSPVLAFLDALMTVQVPIVAAVQGDAVGIGTTMLLHADVVVADASARFSLPFVALGLVPEAASSLLLPRIVGPRTAARMLLLGERLGAGEALAAGLVTEVVPAGDQEEAARGWARRLAEAPRASVRTTRALLHRLDGSPLERSHEEAALFAERLASPEFREAARRLLG